MVTAATIGDGMFYIQSAKNPLLMLTADPGVGKAVVAKTTTVTATTLKGTKSLWRIVQPKVAADKTAGWVKIQSQNLPADGIALYLGEEKDKLVLEKDAKAETSQGDILWKIVNEVQGVKGNDFTLQNYKSGNTKKLSLEDRKDTTFPEVRP